MGTPERSKNNWTETPLRRIEQNFQEKEDFIADLMRTPRKENLEGLGSIDQSKIYASLLELEDLISKPSSSFVDPATSFCASIEHTMQNRQTSGDMISGDSSAQPEEESKTMVINETLGMNGECSIQNPPENRDYQHLSGLYSEVGRRSLVFNNSSSGSCMQQNDSSSVIPGINLHTNAIAPTPEDYNIVDNHYSVYRTSLINAGPFPSFHRPPTCFNQEMLSYIPPKFSSKREIVNVENYFPLLGDYSLESGYMENKEINPSSSKRKRNRLEQAGEGEGSCKRCTCKKSKCLKLYCECFAAGIYCMGPCACISCFNKPVHGDIVRATRKQIKARYPFAFSPKVTRGSNSLSEIEDNLGTTPASARHKRGCNCKKSGCMKKYCQCYQSGVGCLITCRCEGCKNKFGTKDGLGVISMDHELEEGETNATKRVELNRSLQITYNKLRSMPQHQEPEVSLQG